MTDRRDAEDYFGYLDGHQTAEIYDVPKADQDLLGRLKQEFFLAQQVKSSYERDWELYRQYLKGEQLVIHRLTGNVVRLSHDDGRRLRSVRNICRPAGRALVGKASRVKPALRVTPATADWNEQHGAATADKLLEYFARTLQLDVKYVDVANMLPWAGNGFTKVEWDRTAGRRVAYCEVCDYVGEHDEIGAICPQCESQRELELDFQQQETILQGEIALGAREVAIEDGIANAQQGNMPEPGFAEAMQTEVPTTPPPIQPIGPLAADQDPPALIEMAEGEISVRVIDPRDVYVPEGTECIKEADWICYRRVLSVPKARAKFPEMAEFIQVEGDLGAYNGDSYRYGSTGDTGEVREYQNHVAIFEWHEQPTEAYPNGRIIWHTEKMILREEESPYFRELQRFPFYHFGWDVNDGEFWREPPMHQAWHRQRELNKVEQAIREHTEISLRPKWIVPRSAVLAANEITSASNQVLHWSGIGAPPQQISPAPVPQDLWNRGESLANDIYQLFGVTQQEAGLATTDPNGRAMAIMEAESNQTIGPMLTRNNAEWKEMHKALLALAVKYYHNDRLMAIPGPDGYETFAMKEINLTAGWDIILAEEDSMSRNPAVRLQQALDLMNAGVFTDPATGVPDTKAFLRMARLNNPEAGYDIDKYERARAAEIPYKLDRGWEWEPKDYDNPLIYAEVLKGWLLSARGRTDIPKALIAKAEAVFNYVNMWAITGAMPDPAMMGGANQGAPMGSGTGGTPPGGAPPPGASQPGQDMTAPGGSANNAGHVGTDAMAQGAAPNAAAAQQTLQGTDEKLEGMAQSTANREG
jgi:rubrerythrin